MIQSRWSEYYLDHQYEDFWRRRLGDQYASVCLILGVGFDPRSLVALERISRCGTPGQLGYMAMLLCPSANSKRETQKIEAFTTNNRQRLATVTNGKCIECREVDLRDESGYVVGGRKAVDLLHAHLEEIAEYRDVVVDISALPRTLFFPIIAFLCKQADLGRIRNLHVAVTEDPAVDGKIRGSEYGDADYIPHFRLERPKKIIWLPVIGKNEKERLEKIHDLLESDCIEVCPILPFPAKNLRRADDLLVQLKEVLSERIFVSKTNIILCDERTPFDIYRHIVRIDTYYHKQLQSLPGYGEITTVISPLANKMLSLGALLAAIERKLPVSYVEASVYEIETGDAIWTASQSDSVTSEVWLAGEPYESTLT